MTMTWVCMPYLGNFVLLLWIEEPLFFFRLYEVTIKSIVFGDVDLRENSPSHLEVEIERVYIHPMYNTISSWNDLAVLKLATPVNFTDYVRPICSQHGSNGTTYSSCYTAGWGMQTFISNGM